MLKVKIIHPDKLLFEGEAEYVVAPGVTGALGIMPGHTIDKATTYIKKAFTWPLLLLFFNLIYLFRGERFI